eukprot:sb/3473557/
MVRQRFQNNFIPEQHDQDSLHRPNIRLKTFSSESDSSYKSLTTKSPPVTSTRRKPVWPLLNMSVTENPSVLIEPPSVLRVRPPPLTPNVVQGRSAPITLQSPSPILVRSPSAITRVLQSPSPVLVKPPTRVNKVWRDPATITVQRSHDR